MTQLRDQGPTLPSYVKIQFRFDLSCDKFKE